MSLREIVPTVVTANRFSDFAGGTRLAEKVGNFRNHMWPEKGLGKANISVAGGKVTVGSVAMENKRFLQRVIVRRNKEARTTITMLEHPQIAILIVISAGGFKRGTRLKLSEPMLSGIKTVGAGEEIRDKLLGRLGKSTPG